MVGSILRIFFNNPVAWDLIKNTFLLSIYQITITFPLPVLLALALNEIKDGIFKRSVQMFTYAPYFISTVVIVSMIILMLSPRTGIVNNLIELIGGQSDMFRSIFVWSDAWQITGSSIPVLIIYPFAQKYFVQGMLLGSVKG